MDVIYPLGKGTCWNNFELLYSIQSVKKYLKGHRNIYIIGEHPGFEFGFIHIPHIDRFDKDTNICDKVAVACRHPDVSDDFVFMNDDVYFNKPMRCEDIPVTYIGELRERATNKVQNKFYKIVLMNTYNALIKKWLPTKDFDGHMPQVFNKKKFLDAASGYHWRIKHGFAVKSIYYNTHRVEGVMYPDMKINKPVQNVPAYVGNRWCFSIGNNGLTNEMKLFLKHAFL